MKRTPTLQAAAAALGVLAGFALSSAGRPSLEGAVAPYAVQVAWHGPAPTEVVREPLEGGRLREPAELPRRLKGVKARPAVRPVSWGQESAVKARLTVVRSDKRRCHDEHGQS